MKFENSEFSTVADCQVRETAPAGNWRGVFFNGPSPAQHREGDDGQSGSDPVWTVYVGDAHAETVDTVYTCHNFTAAEKLAQAIARDRQLELIHEATTA